MMTRSSDARHVRRILFLVSLIALLVFFEPSSRAQTTSITQVFSRAALGGNDFIDWGQLPQPFQTLANSFSVTSQQGQMAQIKNVGPSILFSDQQGNPWMGNFAPGDFLLGAGTSFEIVFSQPIRGLGAQVGYDLCNCPFVAHLVLFDSSHNVLASLTAPGLESSAADNSAVFIGAMDSVAEIKSAQFFANSATLNVDTFTINRMSLTTAGCQVNVDTLAAFTSMLASFTAPSGLTLSEYAPVCGFAGFDWQQTITSMPCPNKFEPYKPAALPLSDFCPGGGIRAKVPFSDPVDGGWTYIPVDNFNVDPYPFYYATKWLLNDERNPNDACALNPFILGPCIIPVVSSDDKILNFYDAPADAYLPDGTFMGFTTSLVGVRRDGTPSAPLFHWSWTSTFNGTSGGTSATYNTFPTDPGSGTGGVSITSINDVPQTSPSVSCVATPNSLWPPNGKSVEVTISGTITPGTQIIPARGTTYAVTDEYGQVQPSGSITLDGGGSYSFGVPLVASRNGGDLDGRTYRITVIATDSIGNVGSCSATVTVPHDQGH